MAHYRAMRIPVRPSIPAAALLLTLVTAIGAVVPVPAAAIEFEFPPGETGYHTYPEMAAVLAATAAAHPDIVSRVSIGTSYQGRQLWAVKVSDNVERDEAEPEVLFEASTTATSTWASR
jgi:hypothetical protein